MIIVSSLEIEVVLPDPCSPCSPTKMISAKKTYN